MLRIVLISFLTAYILITVLDVAAEDGAKIAMVVRYMKILKFGTYVKSDSPRSSDSSNDGRVLFVMAYNQYLMIRTYLIYASCYIYYLTEPFSVGISKTLATECLTVADEITDFLQYSVSDNTNYKALANKVVINERSDDIYNVANIVHLIEEIRNKINQLHNMMIIGEANATLLFENLASSSKVKPEDLQKSEYEEIYRSMLEYFGKSLIYLVTYFDAAVSTSKDICNPPDEYQRNEIWKKDFNLTVELQDNLKLPGYYGSDNAGKYARLLANEFKANDIDLKRYSTQDNSHRYYLEVKVSRYSDFRVAKEKKTTFKWSPTISELLLETEVNDIEKIKNKKSSMFGKFKAAFNSNSNSNRYQQM